MVVELSTDYVMSITPATYWTEFCYDVADECWEDFLKDYDEAAKEAIENLLDETEFAGTKLFDVKREQPREYNFRDDWLVFKMNVRDDIVEWIKLNVNDSFFEWAYDNYHSYDGFISYMPYQREDYFEALEYVGNEYSWRHTQAQAIGMYIGYEIWMNNDLKQAQRDLEDTVYDIISGNGYGVDDEDEEDEYYE